jgi:hypothetical protein
MSLPAVRNKMEVPEFKEGSERPLIWSSEDMNLHVAILRALVNPQVKWGVGDKAEFSDANFVIQLDAEKAAGGSVLVPMVLTDFSAADHFVCRELSTAAGEGGTTAYTAGAEDIIVAKPYHLRRTPYDGKTVSVTVEAWNGSVLSTSTVQYSHTYKSATYRLKTDITNSIGPEKQTIIPRFVPAIINSETGAITNAGATILFASKVSELFVSDVAVEWIAHDNGWAWMTSNS